MITDADILLDIDRKRISAREFAERMRFISIFTAIEFKRLTIYETHKGLHVYLWCKDKKPSPQEKVVIQLALGSDYRREIFNWLRVKDNTEDARWNILFQGKYDDNGKRVSREEHTELAIRLEEQIMALYEILYETNE